MAGGGLLLLVLTACSVPGSGPDPDVAVVRLAAALSAGDVSGVDFVSGSAAATKEHAAVMGGLESATVAAGSAETDGEVARASLEWTWKLGSQTWSYDTEVKLTKGETDDGSAWMVHWSPTLVEPSLTGGEKLVRSTIKAERGSILGAGDRAIVAPRPVLRVGIDKTTVDPGAASRSAARVARLVDIDVPDFDKQVTAAGPEAFVQGIVYRRSETPSGLLSALGQIPGARAISDELPLAPTKDFASAILGSVGPATAELVEGSEGRVQPGDDVGLSGLQKRYDEQLSGTRGATIVAVDAQGERRTLFTADAVPGAPLRTTLDLETQQVAQRVLSEVGPASALVAIRPSTGDLVAVASGPGSKGYSTATVGQYAPGSTFKVVSALALLRAGLTPGTVVSCPVTTVVDGKTFKNYDDYPASGLGRISFEDALANSCNTAFISQRDELGADSLAEAAAALGLGVDHDTGFSSFFGEVGRAGSPTQAAASMIGQGTVLASPMAMATVVASVVKGSAVLPRLVLGHQVEQQPPREPLSPDEAEQLRTMMRAVVERGSGSILREVPGGPVIAKTGTAEFGDQPPLPTHAWMVAGRGDLAVAVFVERGDSGSGTAGPVLREFLTEVR
jgi:cell division protein FtsI/penicillin-binding protein 2